jgi:hypothetical protein
MVNSNIWGVHAWKFMHYITLGYPEIPTEEHKNNYKNFFISLKNVLPCSICAKHYEENLKKIPLTDDILNSKDKLIKWCIDLHNIINKMLNKKILSYDEAYKQLFINNNINNTHNNISNSNNYYDNNIMNFEFINKSQLVNDSKIDNSSNYAIYSNLYDNNVEKYYHNINEHTNNIITPSPATYTAEEASTITTDFKQQQIESSCLKSNNYFNILNPFTLLLILLVLIIIAIIFKKNDLK